MSTSARRRGYTALRMTAASQNVGSMGGGRDLIGLQGMDVGAMRRLLASSWDMANAWRGARGKAAQVDLAGRAIANLFFENSTRTRVSFTIAAQRLGANVVDLSSAGSSVSKGETLVDTVRTIEAMGVDALVVRHASSGAAALAAATAEIPVLNAGDGAHEHPTQGLLDTLTVAEAHGRTDGFDLRGLRLAIVGDIAHSRVARSDIAAWTALGASVVCVGPPTLAPRTLEALGVEVRHDLDAVLPEVDGLQALRVQFERAASLSSPRDYAAAFQINGARLARMKKSAVVMHPGPMNRGLEIAGEAAEAVDGPRGVVLRQVENGVYMRMAALLWCLGLG